MSRPDQLAGSITTDQTAVVLSEDGPRPDEENQ